MRYFFHVMAVSFLGLAAAFQSWPLGLCAVAVLAVIAGKDAHQNYLEAKKESQVFQSFQKVLEDNKKLKEEVEKCMAAVGQFNYKVQQFAHYVGAPNE